MMEVKEINCLFLSREGASVRSMPWPPPSIIRISVVPQPKLRYAPGQSFVGPLPAREIRTFYRQDVDIYIEEGA